MTDDMLRMGWDVETEISDQITDEGNLWHDGVSYPYWFGETENGSYEFWIYDPATVIETGEETIMRFPVEISVGVGRLT